MTNINKNIKERLIMQVLRSLILIVGFLGGVQLAHAAEKKSIPATKVSQNQTIDIATYKSGTVVFGELFVDCTIIRESESNNNARFVGCNFIKCTIKNIANFSFTRCAFPSSKVIGLIQYGEFNSCDFSGGLIDPSSLADLSSLYRSTGKS